MSLFTKLDGDAAICFESGIFYQRDVYERNGELYIKQGQGFVRVYEDGRTTKPTLSLKELHTDKPLYKDKLGRVTFGREGNATLAAASPLKMLEK